LAGLGGVLQSITLAIVWNGGKELTMGKKQILDIIIGFSGLSILLWLFLFALKDILARANAKRKTAHNTIIAFLCLIYIVKIVVKDILPLLKLEI
jgi:hypothetical protein